MSGQNTRTSSVEQQQILSPPVPPRTVDLTGQIYGLLVVEAYAGKGKGRDGMSYWTCRCLCGQVVRKRGYWLRDTQMPACGLHCPIRLHVLFLANVTKTDACWTWGGYRNKNDGYGRTKIRELAHRVSYEMFCGPIPNGLFVLHRCDNPPCVRPDHLFLGTGQDNVDDCHSKDRHARGERNGHARLTAEDVLAIRREHASGVFTNEEIAMKRGIGADYVSRLARRRGWKHLS